MKVIEPTKIRRTGARAAVVTNETSPMSKNIAAVVLVAGVLGLPGSVQAGGPRYDDYYYGGGYHGGYYAPTPPGPPLPPVPVRQAPIPPPPLYAPPVYGWVFIPLRLPEAAANITIGLETTAQTRATRHHTWARDGENATTAHVA